MITILDLLNGSNVGLLIIGTITGLVAAILGIGGGLLMVPVLAYWGAEPIQATATSSLAIVIGAASGTFHNGYTKQLQLLPVVTLSLPAMLSSFIGVTIAGLLPDRGLLLSFAGLQVVAIFLIDFKRQLQQPPQSPETPSLQTPDQPPSSTHTSKLIHTSSIGILAGILAGLFGVGGGIIMVPLQMLFLKQTIKDAVRISLGAVCLIAISTVTQHALKGNVLWQQGLFLGFGTLCGAQLGARLLIKLPDAVIRQLFRGLLILMAISMVYRAWQSG